MHVFKYLTLAFFVLATFHSYSQSTTFTGPGTQWNNPANWTNGVPSPFDNVVISSGATVLITTNVNMVSSTSFQNYGTVLNSANFSSSGTVQNYNSFQNNSFGTLNMSGFSVVLNFGSISNSGAMSINGVLQNNDSFQNSSNSNAVVNISGELLNNGDLINNGYMGNNFGGEITNNGNGELTNYGEFTNDGVIDNLGTMVNQNSFDNSGTISNLEPGIIENQNTFNNNGFIDNDGTIDNDGVLDNLDTIYQCGVWVGNLPLTNDYITSICFPGCMDSSACNFDTNATYDDGSCTYIAAGECDCDGNTLDAMDFNNNGICDNLEILGCTYASATNYNSQATMDDGSCLYLECDITIDNQQIYDDAYSAGIASVDITVDNQDAFDAGVSSVVCPGYCIGDLNLDNTINSADLLQFISVYGTDCE
ncbi:MAG: hypothetical protein MK081_02295 [Flavobacteriales bacterium]|nr:hypothetical protein [Flavobacteriales bacterium]